MLNLAGKHLVDLHGLTWGHTEGQGSEDQGRQMGFFCLLSNPAQKTVKKPRILPGLGVGR